ncbi:MAG TPA: hypothetical protein VNN20_06530 [Thermodesulfobacteriota bacterium]|nr:hypothetical protein [Thermodesulfobacteriota bacterium]
MGRAEKNLEKKVLDAFRKLSPEKKQEVLDLIEFIESKDRVTKWIEFDEWAVNLAKEKGFNHLTEEDVAQIVEAHRSANKRG